MYGKSVSWVRGKNDPVIMNKADIAVTDRDEIIKGHQNLSTWQLSVAGLFFCSVVILLSQIPIILKP